MLLDHFRRDQDGSVLPMFALAIVPVVGFVGAAIDYSRAAATRTELQAALDAAALIVFRDATSSTAAQLDQKALDAVKAQFNRAQVQVPVVKAAYTASPPSVTVTGTTSIQSDFTRLIGVPQLDIKASSTVTWGLSKLRVALALDNTGSMADDGKIDALKTATKSLLSSLQAASKSPGDVQVSIVPFAKDVNIGTGYSSATWIDWSTWNTQNFRVPSTGRNAYCDPTWVDQYGTRWCYDGVGAVQKSNSWPVAPKTAWQGCVMDRGTSSGPTGNYDVSNAAPVSGTAASLVPADTEVIYNGSTVTNTCPTPLMTLGYNWTALNAKVDMMQPAGSTNQTIGLVWAWHTLTPTSPLNAPALDPNVPTQQYIILLSDGLNTQDRWYGDGSSVSTQVDARMSAVCTNAKAAGIQVYTVQVNTGGDPTSTVLKNCASSADKFFELKTASGMVSTFNTIAGQLAALRISK